MLAGAGFDKAEQAASIAAATSQAAKRCYMSFGLTSEVILATPGKFVCGYFYQREQNHPGTLYTAKTFWNKDVLNKGLHLRSAMKLLAKSGIVRFVEDIRRDEEFKNEFGHEEWFQRSSTNKIFWLGCVKRDPGDIPAELLGLSSALKKAAPAVWLDWATT